jgi:hypothetical protein
MLFSRFYVDYLLLLRDWTALARREVGTWPTRRILEDLLRQDEQLSGYPERVRTRPGTIESAPEQAPNGGRRRPAG